VPVVFTREEVRAVLACLEGTKWLVTSLLYGSGLRLHECLSLRIKDIDFGYRQITVRDGKGGKDRVTVLPATLVEPLQRQIEKVCTFYGHDLRAGCGSVWLPHALARKYPNAAREMAWQFVFPAAKLSRDPVSGALRHHHLHVTVI